ncbi:MAG: hypothetical protein AB1451_00030 [Nitrospirota bacterium]
MTKFSERRQHSIRVRIREFGIPPIHDGLVLGKKSPIGCEAFRRAISLLVATPFEHIELDDGVIGDILIRANILRRIPKDKLISFVLQQVKPLMEPEDVLHMDVDLEVSLETDAL